MPEWAFSPRTVATITEETDYAEGVRRTSVAQFEKNGGKVIAEERYGSDTTDFRSQLTKLIEANPDEYNLKGSFRIASKHSQSWPHPVIFDGKLYLRDQHQLHCYDITSK